MRNPQPDPAWRKHKRYTRQSEVYVAWCNGQYAAEIGRQRRPPYPPGRRQDEWLRGYDLTVAEFEGAALDRHTRYRTQ
jgi:hypothetical protein